jgi:hypothetical protein
MLSVVTWRWGSFGPEYVNTLRNMLERHLHLPHQLFCLTDDLAGIDPRVVSIQLPTEFANTPRCQRRMWQYSRQRKGLFGDRMLLLDLDTVLFDDITSLIDRPEPIVMLRIGYANVLSPAFALMNTGVLHGAYEAYRDDPLGYLQATAVRNPSDLAMLNHFLKGRNIDEWTEADGFAIYFGHGYRPNGPNAVSAAQPNLPHGTRVVILGGADKAVLDEGRYDWVRTHWR